jgi:cell wall-associated NlpC family hydrolase
VAVAGALAPIAAVADPGQIAAKKAEASQVLAQIQELDVSLERASEAYDRATVRLSRVESAQALNRRTLAVAKRNLRREQRAVARRLVAIYVGDDGQSTLGILLGASSVSDFVDRMDTLKQVAAQDRRVARQVRQFKGSVEHEKRQLAAARVRADELVAARRAQRASIDGQLAERHRLAESIKAEIGRLQAEERARQERLRREAAARLAAQRAEAARLQAAREAAVAQARANGASDLQAQAVAEAVAPSADSGIVAVTPDASVAPSSGLGGQAVSIAMGYLGVPYVWGGASPSGFDCSGLVVYVFGQLGRSLPHYTGDLWNEGVPVSQDQLEPGDLVFFDGLGHVGIYIGGGQFVHAPHTGDVVKISSLSDSWYSSTYDGARRIL